jgi:hypothetical protein
MTNNTSWRRWYSKHAKRKIGWQQRRREEIRRWWNKLKDGMSCEQCGEDSPACLHFHHRDATNKLFEISNAVSDGRAREKILAELEKCAVLCANCHLKLHWSEWKM